MEIKNEFVVPAGVDTTWDLLLDVERIVPCVSGAELTEIVDDSTWKGKMAVKLGPIRLSFVGQVHLEEKDEANQRVQLHAKGQEARGKGNAQASVTSVLKPQDGGTKVSIQTDLKLSGPVAQYGRGMIQDISMKMANDFAECIASKLGPAPQAATREDQPVGASVENVSAPTEPLKAGRLFTTVVWRAFLRTLKRVYRAVMRLFKRSQ